MFIDQYSIVTLEYHYYQNDCKYSTLNACDEHIDHMGNLVNIDGDRVINKCGTENYQKDGACIMSTFDRDGVVNYKDDKINIVNKQREMHNPEFFRVDTSQKKVGTQGAISSKLQHKIA